MLFDKPTSLVSFVSCDHGRMRREERDIEKRDLQKALKYGTRERTYKGRWKIEYDGVTMITDSTMTREITAYFSPPAHHPVDEDDLEKHRKAKIVIENKPELCKSHTVLVVDNSGSMQTHDIPAHRDRQIAAYTTMALEYIADHLINEIFSHTDVVSLVEFDETAEIVFEREPCSWVLYNKLLSRRESSNFASRQEIHRREAIRADSNYLPALALTQSLLAVDHHAECALAVFFLSDGEPSDARQNGWTPLYARSQIVSAIRKMSASYPDFLSLTTVGFGNPAGDFSTLEAMVEASNQTTGSDRAKFAYCEKLAYAVGMAASSLATSLSDMRTSLVGRSTKLKGPKRTVVSEQETGQINRWKYYKILDHRVYDPRVKALAPFNGVPPGAVKADIALHQGSLSKYLALNVSSCGSGAERVAFRCFLADAESSRSFVHEPMVAKETNLEHRMSEVEKFHRAFCEGQGLASFLADEFNRYVRNLTPGSRSHSRIPTVSFLPCSVLVLEDDTVSDKGRSVLVERLLDTEQYQWSKWNDNGGGIGGKAYHAPLNIEFEFRSIMQGMNSARLQGFAEENSEEESDNDSFDSSGDHNPLTDVSDVPPSEYIQAFSHFTYVHTCRKLLVCDLQGVYNTDVVPPTFELTDPAIHYRSSRGRSNVYGYTDKGQAGIDLFFDTHTCNRVCKMLKLSSKNANRHKGKARYQEDWCQRHNEKFGPTPGAPGAVSGSKPVQQNGIQQGSVSATAVATEPRRMGANALDMETSQREEISRLLGLLRLEDVAADARGYR